MRTGTLVEWRGEIGDRDTETQGKTEPERDRVRERDEETHRETENKMIL